jgi:hypothetical protein
MRRSLKLALVATLPLAMGCGVMANKWLRAHGLTVGELATELRRGDTARFTWRSVDRKHWQITASAIAEEAEVTDAGENTSLGCAPTMVRIAGGFRREGRAVTGEIERLQDAACTDWISRDFPARCRVFDRETIASAVLRFPTEPMDYCIDRFEYPNALGAYPVIVVTFREAEALCKKADKRLCTEDEWTFACEGEDVRPYPYGWTRDDTACVIDRPWRPFGEGALQPRDGDQAREELDRLWQGEPSGSRPACRGEHERAHERLLARALIAAARKRARHRARARACSGARSRAAPPVLTVTARPLVRPRISSEPQRGSAPRWARLAG